MTDCNFDLDAAWARLRREQAHGDYALVKSINRAVNLAQDAGEITGWVDHVTWFDKGLGCYVADYVTIPERHPATIDYDDEGGD